MDMFTKVPALLDENKVAEYDFEGCWTRTHPEGPYDDTDVAMALAFSMGNISKAAGLLGRSRRSLHGFILRHQLMSDFLEDLESIFMDNIEEVHKRVAYTDKDVRAFFLRTKGRDRGYVTRNESTGQNGGPIEVSTIDTSSMSTEALRELQKAMRNSNQDHNVTIEG